MSDTVQLLVPFAASDAPRCRAALPALALPALQKLLARLKPGAVDEAAPTTLSTPHERWLAAQCGLDDGDGLVPWAAWSLHQAGHQAADEAWAWLTPCHWRVGRDHVAMDDPQQLQLEAQESQAVLAAMRPFFEEDGIALDYDSPLRWRARGDIFRGLACASLDRVIGRRVDDWLPRAPVARPIRRLQQEMQMLLYTHPLNDARQQRGLPPVNSFWVSGAGALPASAASTMPLGLRVLASLREPALRDDAQAWAAAWMQIDAQEIAPLLEAVQQGRPVTLTLCGERAARSWSNTAGGTSGWWRRVASVFQPQPLESSFEKL